MATDLTRKAVKHFGLREGQMRSDKNGFPFAKNQWWFLKVPSFDGNIELGYGDLSQEDVLRIAELLEAGEIFTTFNERQGMDAREKFRTPFELDMTPRMIITNKDVRFPQDEERKRRQDRSNTEATENQLGSRA